MLDTDGKRSKGWKREINQPPLYDLFPSKQIIFAFVLHANSHLPLTIFSPDLKMINWNEINAKKKIGNSFLEIDLKNELNSQKIFRIQIKKKNSINI